MHFSRHILGYDGHLQGITFSSLCDFFLLVRAFRLWRFFAMGLVLAGRGIIPSKKLV
jgi:hypothetical protein